jgi:tripartite-type tricarboxylate transporter receptor subunit TctC
VPLPAGGGADTIARALAQKMTDTFGQQIVVDNRPGASGAIGTDIAANAMPDGYTALLLASNLAILEGAGGNRPYDLRKDLQALSRVAVAPNILVVNSRIRATNVQELVALAKAQPGKLLFASNGIGSSSHLSAELFSSMAGIRMVHGPYKGGPPGVTATIAGETQLMFSAIVHVLPHARAGKIRALAVTGKTRTPAAPEVPTVAESGLPGYESLQWWLFMAPAGTPKAAQSKLHAALLGALADGDLKERFARLGVEPQGGTPEAAAQFLRDEISKWGKIVKAAGIELK